MDSGTETETKNGKGQTALTPEDVDRLFNDGYRDIEILPDGTIRERTGASDEAVTRTLKTERTWY